MKLQILVPQYKETDEIVKPLLDSIAIQQNVDMEDIGVIICNDGSDVKLSEEFLKSYPFRIDYYQCEHGGVSATRNACLEHATAEYVMFCDADDMFYNACGLWIVFNEMEKNGGFNALVSIFTEETRTPDGKVFYVNRQTDLTFVHGKIYRRKYLIKNNIRWNPKLTIHEDSYFNCLAIKLVEKEKDSRYCMSPFYLWKWRDDSVCRHDPLYLNKTFVNMLDSNTELVREFLSRGRSKDAQFFAVNMIYDTYFSLNCDRWWNEEGQKYLDMTERRFARYYKEFRHLMDGLKKEEQLQIIAGQKNRFFQEGMALERITFNDWIKKIESMI